MESDRFQRAERLFHEALALTPSGRDRYVQQAAGEDNELASRVHRMIRFAECRSPTAAILDDSPAAPSDGGENKKLVGATLGRYRIDDLIGEGGFGAVYKAQQEHPVRRAVALKILKSGMDSRQVIARFDAERQALAMMEHPNIATVLDAGQTDAELGSRPYFVMELVSGAPVTTYCDEHHVDCTSRLELFIAICQAVQHAHQKGIIHRDLKPSNILVTQVNGAAVPKIIDFGIAKAIGQQTLSDHTLVTEARQILGTPQYMSPEQGDLDVRHIDTRSDIYSLGVVLYELLTGSAPLQADALREASLSRIQQMIRDEAIERPSTRLLRRGADAGEFARRLSTDAPALCRRLRGDLDWIVLKALDHDRDRRYSSASALADDIQRHLNHEPVLAGPPSAGYRIGKFVRRHRIGVVASAFVTLALLGGAIGITTGMIRARDAAEQAIKVNDFMRQVLSSPNPEQQGADVRLVTVLDDASRRASSQFADHSELEIQVRELLGAVYAKLTRLDDALREYRRAADLRRLEDGPDDPRTLQVELSIATCLSHLQRVGEVEAALRELEPRIRKVFGARHANSAIIEVLESRVSDQHGRIDDAEKQLRATLAWVNATFERDSEIRREALGNLMTLLIRRIHYATDLAPERTALLDEIYAIATDLRKQNLRSLGPNAIPTLSSEATLAEVAQRRRLSAEAIELCQSILERTRNLLSECNSIRTEAMFTLANALRSQGRSREAAEALMRNIECQRTIYSPDDVLLLSSISDAMPMLDAAGMWEKGESIARELIPKLQKYGNAHGPITCGPELYLARFCAMQGRLDEAAAIFQRWLNDEQAITEADNRARLHLFHGGYLVLRGEYEQAEREIGRAVELTGGNLTHGTWMDHPDEFAVEYIRLYRAWGKAERVAEYRRLRREIIQEYSGVAAPDDLND